jgi:hypothetical protein
MYLFILKRKEKKNKQLDCLFINPNFVICPEQPFFDEHLSQAAFFFFAKHLSQAANSRIKEANTKNNQRTLCGPCGNND